MSAGIFVTATGTEVGKTYVSAGLIRAIRRSGRVADALKPVASGFDSAHLADSDAAILLGALGREVDAEGAAALSPWRLRAPLSPDMAARLEGRDLPLPAILAACRAALRPDRLTIIEGIGGVMVPLGPGRTMLDLAAALALPTVLVAPTGLGALSHLLTARAAMLGRGLPPRAVALSETPGSTVPLEAMRETLAGHGLSSDVFVLRRGPAEDQGRVFDALLTHLLGAPERVATASAN